MLTTLRKEWQITIPESVIREIGAGEGSTLECWAEGGEIRLRPTLLTGGKK